MHCRPMHQHPNASNAESNSMELEGEDLFLLGRDDSDNARLGVLPLAGAERFNIPRDGHTVSEAGESEEVPRISGQSG